MVVGLLSDTHNQFDRTERAVRLLMDAGAEAFVHCGDFTDPGILELCAARPCWFVFGNNDDDLHPGWQSAANAGAVCLNWCGEVSLGGQRIGVAHGHNDADVRRLLKAEPDYLCTGHSHVPDDRRKGRTRCVNPGALHRAREFSVAVLDLARDDLRFLPVPR